MLPGLPSRIRLEVHPLSRDLAVVGGVTGWAEDPRTVVIYVSTVFAGGVSAAINTGLAPVLYHEFHHLVRGWTIAGNQFSPGITIAAVNEGLANVFSETYTHTAFPGNAYPANVHQWWQEITRLPVTANYNQWMVEHSDGRLAMGLTGLPPIAGSSRINCPARTRAAGGCPGCCPRTRPQTTANRAGWWN